MGKEEENRFGLVYDGALTENIPGKVNIRPVKYELRGLKIAANVYVPADFDENGRYAAVVVAHPNGGVKEQGPCVYGNELAQKGFMVLTFDQSFMGESGGFPRNVSSPDIFVENFSAAVDFLGLQKFVDREKIGVIGICGSGGLYCEL